MSARYPELRAIDGLPRKTLVLAPHPDDEVIGFGGTAALLAERGDDVRVLVLTDGAAGGDAEVRRAESERAAEQLGVSIEFWGLADGALGSDFRLVERLLEELERSQPELVVTPSPWELHDDHRAAATAAFATLARAQSRRVLLYGINTAVPATVLVDVSAAIDTKRRALECFESQINASAVEKVLAQDLARTMNIDDPDVRAAEGFVELDSADLAEYRRRAESVQQWTGERGSAESGPSAPRATAVISTWNKAEDLRANLDGLRSQTRPFDAVVVVDNASSDETAQIIEEHYPEVRLIVMPHSQYGACETFNIGFSSSQTPLTAILDDDVVLPPEWLEKTVERMLEEPDTTAIVSTEVIEPEMPESYVRSIEVARERYMSTFRGCASLARSDALKQAGYYDERLFIYGNERDLTCRLLNLGFRVLQFPSVRAFHKTPFGIKMGKRSLYYHARNAWLTMIKYAPIADLLRLPWLVVRKVLLRGSGAEAEGEVTDATGTIGIGRSLRETPGAWWVLAKAGASVLYNLPYCIKHRAPVRAQDFELPLS